MNWIVVQEDDNQTNLANTYLIGTADVGAGGNTVVVTSQYDVSGASYFLGKREMGGTSCSGGVFTSAGVGDNLNGTVYFSSRGAGVFKTTPGKATFFFTQSPVVTTQLASKTFEGVTFDASSANDVADFRNVTASSDATGKVFTVQPLSDASAGTVDSGPSAYTDTVEVGLDTGGGAVTSGGVNFPASGMVVGRVTRTGTAATCASPPCRGRIAGVVHMEPDYGIRIVFSGENPNDTALPYTITIVHKHPRGSSDTSFNGTGMNYSSFNPASSYHLSRGILANSDGSVIVAGTTDVAGNGKAFGIAKFNEDGTLDTSFGGNGTGANFRNLTAGDDESYGIARLQDGKILTTGHASNDFAVVRWNADGTYDTSFVQNFGSEDRGYSIVVQPDGKILVGGWGWGGSTVDFILARFTTSLALDTTFGGGDGYDAAHIGGNNDYMLALTLQSDGKPVGVGIGEGATTDFAIARWTSAGVLDTTFNGTGKRNYDVSGNNENPYGVAVQPDGKILIAGWRYDGAVNGNNVSLVRLNGNGSTDTTFGSGGTVNVGLSSQGNRNDEPRGMALLPDGKILIGGYATVDSSNKTGAMLARFLSSGTLDTQFGSGAGYIFRSDTVSIDGRWMAMAADGRIFLSGQRNGNAAFTILRFWP